MAELLAEVSAVLERVAEVDPVTAEVDEPRLMVWSLVTSARAELGFRQDVSDNVVQIRECAADADVVDEFNRRQWADPHQHHGILAAARRSSAIRNLNIIVAGSN